MGFAGMGYDYITSHNGSGSSIIVQIIKALAC
jgi:hypothetical protein